MTAAEPIMFPKILHQTWKTVDLSGVPEFEMCSESWRRHHPDYEYRLWDDTANREFVGERFEWYLETWLSFDKNIKRLDTIRYMWMHQYGGIYADLDMECLQNLKPLLDEHRDREILLFCDFDRDGTCLSVNPALIVSKPGSKFWRNILEYAGEHSDRFVTHCTGPDALGVVARQHREEFDIAFLDQNELIVRKSKKDVYRRIPGNENDWETYRDVYCTTEKPAKYYEDKKRKYVADWHGTPAQFRWHNEYGKWGARIQRAWKGAPSARKWQFWR